MAKTGVSKFRFVSPGVQVAEIDNSQLPREPQDIGPVIIGTSMMGPALRPVQVDSFSDFIEIFGNPSPGGQATDVWRNGNFGISPTYAAYAAQAHLANNSPVTFVRLLGRSNDGNDGTAGATAGWKVGTSYAQDYSTGGAFGLWLIDSGTAGAGTRSTASGTLAAIFYCSEGRVELTGTVLGCNSAGVVETTASAGVLIHSTATDRTFEAVIRSGSAVNTGESNKITFNFTKTSENYIRKRFNTDPTKIDPDTRQYAEADREMYFLGETFDRDVDEHIKNTGASASRILGVITPLANDNTDFNVNNSNLAKGGSGWVFSQDLSSYSVFQPESTVKKLFRFRTIEGGEWEQANLKISIRDILAGDEVEDYGSFTVEVRDASDNDTNPQPLEVFSNCNLNPNSPNYIAAKIGDSYAEWSDSDRRYREYGNYPNQSRYIYVVMNDTLPALDNASLLPFGYYGPLRLRSWYVTSSVASAVESSNILKPDTDTKYNNPVMEKPGVGAIADSPTSVSKSVGVNAIVTWLSGAVGANPFSGTFHYPRTYLRMNSAGRAGNTYQLSNQNQTYFGLDTTVSGTGTRHESSYVDVVRGLPDGFRDGDQALQSPAIGSSGDTEYSYIFSMDNVTLHSGSTADSDTPGQIPATNVAYYLSGSRRVAGSLSSTGSNTYKSVLEAGYDQFTMPVFGGFNGIDIRERNPFNDYTLGGTRSATESETTSYAYNSIKLAIDACSDPEVVECNLMSVPGVTTSGITDHLLDVCRRRADALAVVDINGNYIPRDDRASYVAGASADADSTVRGTVSTAVSNLKNRFINNSYGVTYYPWIQIRDSGQLFWAPPSIAAIGTYANVDANSAVWFAPAGFTRGGLTEGAAGIQITGVKQRLTSKERDQLYDVNINPIAQFPAEGIVMFGQKTLQRTRSALDRVNVRRLMIHVKKEVSRIAARLLFDQNVDSTWDRFTGQVVPFLDQIRLRLGLEDYRVILDRTTTTPDLVDRNIMYAKIFLKPARSIEFIAIDFVITNTGAAFED